MRILFWTDWFLPSIGGVEVFSARLLPALARRGHRITVVAGHHRAGLPDETDFLGVTIRRFRFHQVLAANDIGRLAETIGCVARLKQAVAPEVIHLNTLGPSVLFQLQSSTRRSAPVLLTLHSPLAAELVGADTLYGRALRSARWVNCNSRALRVDLCRHLPEMERRSSVVYYGMEPPALPPVPRPTRDPVVLGYGRLVADKGFDLAVHAFAAVQRQFPSARLVLAGEGAARPDLERLAAECGLANAVRFVGAVAPEDVPALINTSSLVVVPSRWDEPFGLVALEAALMARPVIAARAGGLVEVVEDGVTGLLVDKESPGQLAEAVIRLLRDPIAADRMGAAGRDLARELFGWERCVDEYEQLYQWTLSGGNQ
jgi:glycogen(starch) synthase